MWPAMFSPAACQVGCASMMLPDGFDNDLPQQRDEQGR